MYYLIKKLRLFASNFNYSKISHLFESFREKRNTKKNPLKKNTFLLDRTNTNEKIVYLSVFNHCGHICYEYMGPAFSKSEQTTRK